MAGENHTTRVTSPISFIPLTSSGLLEPPSNATLLPYPVTRCSLGWLLQTFVSRIKPPHLPRKTGSPKEDFHRLPPLSWTSYLTCAFSPVRDEPSLIPVWRWRISCRQLSSLTSLLSQHRWSIFHFINTLPWLPTPHPLQLLPDAPASLVSKPPWKSFLPDCLQFLSSHYFSL